MLTYIYEEYMKYNIKHMRNSYLYTYTFHSHNFSNLTEARNALNFDEEIINKNILL